MTLASGRGYCCMILPRHGNSSAILRALLLSLLAIIYLRISCGGPPAHFISRGPGGGGAFFGPSMNPYNPDDMWIGSDMSDLFHSTDFGRTWETVDFRLLLGGNQLGRMEFSSDPKVRYALNGSVPARSRDGGLSW